MLLRCWTLWQCSHHCSQGGQTITEGVGRGSEVEDDVDPVAAREFLKYPSKLLALDLPFIQELKQCATSGWLMADFAACPAHQSGQSA